MARVRSRSVHSLLLAVGVSCAPQASRPPATLTVTQDRAEVRGAVLENVKQCEADGACYLVLQAADAAVHVLYHHGEAPRCDNPDAARTGLGAKTGDAILAAGRYTRTNAYHLVDVCCSDCLLTIASAH